MNSFEKWFYEDGKLLPNVTVIELVGVLFIAMRLGEVIDWSWWYVLAPLYVPYVLGFVVFFVSTLLSSSKD
jgi:hypothetical protein